MSVNTSDLVVYTASNMPEDNTSLTGGAINSGIRASFDDPSSDTKIVVYSSQAADTTQILSLTGRNPAGLVITESLLLSGTSHISSVYTYDRVLKTYLDTAAVGNVSVSGSGVNKIATIPVGESGFRRPFYDATALAATAKTYYEKVFVQNRNSSSALNNAKVLEVNDGLYTKIAFALEDTKKADQTISNREAVPTGITGGFGAGPSGIVDNKLTTGDYQGVWLKLSMDAGEAATNSFFEVQISGTTV